MKRRRLFSLLMYLGCVIFLQLIIVVLFFLAAPSWWEPRIANWLQAPETKLQSDAIIVLGGGTIRRASTGIALFQANLAPRLVITGYKPQKPDDPDAELARARAVAQGVPPSAILLLPTANTFEDAQQIAQFSLKNGLNRITLVTDWFHSRRAICSVRQALDQTTGSPPAEVVFQNAQTPFTPANWVHSEDGMTSVFTELVKVAYYLFNHNITPWSCWPGDVNTPIIFALWLSSGLLSLGIVIAVRQWASRYLLDIPNERSSHSRPVPRGGGVGIVLMTLLPLALYLFTTREISSPIWVTYMVASGLIAVVGWLDDRHSLSAKVRLALQVLLGVGLLAGTGAITRLGGPIVGTIDLGLVVGAGLTLLWVVGLTNAYNFMDGIDGLAGIQAVIAGGAWCLLLALEGQPTLALLGGLIVASSLGFLGLNAPPARIFMGDVGSTFLGFSFAALPVLASHQLENPRLLITGVFFVAPFAFDSALTIVRRALRRENILAPHRSHLYQRMVRMGYSHRQVTGLYLFLCAISALCGLVYYAGSDRKALLAAATVLSMCIALAGTVTWLEYRRRTSPIAAAETSTALDA